MLILTRKPGESVYIGDGIKVTIVEIKGNQIRVGIDAPKDMRIYREEIYYQILEENKQAAEAVIGSEAGLEGLSAQWSARKLSQGPMVTTKVPPKGDKSHQEPEVVVKRKKKKE